VTLTGASGCVRGEQVSFLVVLGISVRASSVDHRLPWSSDDKACDQIPHIEESQLSGSANLSD